MPITVNVTKRAMITTIEEARRFVQEVKVCTIFTSDKTDYPSLWDQVDLPEKQPGEEGWGEKMGAVWTWKNELPARYPDQIFYGKIKGGNAVLMDVEYLGETHFPGAFKPVATLRPIERRIFETISEEPWDTTTLRNSVMQLTGCSKSQFDTALKNLQITMNIARVNDIQIEKDTWVPFAEQYLGIWQRHVPETA